MTEVTTPSRTPFQDISPHFSNQPNLSSFKSQSEQSLKPIKAFPDPMSTIKNQAMETL
jgi:hypothetical protein